MVKKEPGLSCGGQPGLEHYGLGQMLAVCDLTTWGKAAVVVGSVAAPFVGEAGIVGDVGAASTDLAAITTMTVEETEVAATVTTVTEEQALDGSFSIWNWDGYPEGIPKA